MPKAPPQLKTFLCIALPLLAVLSLKLLGFSFVVVLTDSMSPSIPPGSLVVTAPPWLDEPGVGKVVLYRVRLYRGEWLILHRVVRVAGATLLTKGDSRAFVDPWRVSLAEVRGVAILAVPWLGYAVLLTRLWMPVALVGLATYILVRWVVEGVGEG